MNLFILDRDPVVAARMNCDKHVCKIILEAYQMMSLAHLNYGGDHPGLWNARTYNNNHVSLWVRENLSNYAWTSAHAVALCDEYTLRYRRVHKCREMIEWCVEHVPPLPTGALSPFRQAVAEDCYDVDPVRAYHLYYVRYKRRFAKWRLGNVPGWFIRLCRDENYLISLEEIKDLTGLPSIATYYSNVI